MQREREGRRRLRREIRKWKTQEWVRGENVGRCGERIRGGKKFPTTGDGENVAVPTALYQRCKSG